MIDNIENLILLCTNYKNIYIYGAGVNAKYMYQFLMKQKIYVTGFVVSVMAENPPTLFDLPVIEVSRYQNKKENLILTATMKWNKAYMEILDALLNYEIHNVYILPDKLISEIKQKTKLDQIEEVFHVGDYKISHDTPVEVGHSILVMEGKSKEEYHWRFSQEMLKNMETRSVIEIFSQRSAIEEFEQQYGKYHIFKLFPSEVPKSKKTCKVYMARSHVDRLAMQPELYEWIEPIQVGASLTDEKICQIADNVGENISERNGIYSECTAIYWMWKNAPKTDYIGLCHYRRHFDVPSNFIDVLEHSNTDVLVTAPTFVQEGVANFLNRFVPRFDFKIMLEVIEKIQPDYYEVAKTFLQSRFYPPCNLSIMKYELFQKYAEFVFSITFGIEEFYDSHNFYRKDRYMGYLVECLLGIFIMKHKDELKVAYADMKFYA